METDLSEVAISQYKSRPALWGLRPLTLANDVFAITALNRLPYAIVHISSIT